MSTFFSDLVMFLVSITVIQTTHELGHYIFAKKFGYSPSAIVIQILLPGATAILVDPSETRTFYKFTGMILPILAFPFFIIFKDSLFFYRPILFEIFYFLFILVSASNDIRLVVENYSRGEKTIPGVKKISKIDLLLPSWSLVTSKKNWKLWKEKYPESYERVIDKEIFLPWA